MEERCLTRVVESYDLPVSAATCDREYLYTYDAKDGKEYTARVLILDRSYPQEGLIALWLVAPYGWPHLGGISERDGVPIVIAQVVDDSEMHWIWHHQLVPADGFGDS